MSRLVDINNEKFWDILFDEACVEGSQAERIKNELSEISVDEKEIRNKVIEEFTERLCREIFKYDCPLCMNDIKEIAEEIRGAE